MADIFCFKTVKAQYIKASQTKVKFNFIVFKDNIFLHLLILIAILLLSPHLIAYLNVRLRSKGHACYNYYITLFCPPPTTYLCSWPPKVVSGRGFETCYTNGWFPQITEARIKCMIKSLTTVS